MNKESMNWKFALKLALLLSLFWTLIFLLGHTGAGWLPQKVENAKETGLFLHLVRQFVTSTVSFFILFCFQFSIFKRKWKFNKKLGVSIAGSLSITFLFFLAVGAVLYIFDVQPPGEKAFVPAVFFMLVAAIIISTMTILLATLFYIMSEREKSIVENQKLSVENMRNRYEALKNQLNPHFLFNTLNTLDGLIGSDTEKAHEYLQNLSSSFRYTMQNKEIITLKEELEFVKTYACLMKIRYGDNLIIRYAVDEKYGDFYIMPVTLQLLIENAIKHNVINDEEPLTIHIETTPENTIKVSNAVQPKMSAETGEGIGLANLVERYNLLFKKEVLIAKNETFAVEIPLIEQINDNSKIQV